MVPYIPEELPVDMNWWNWHFEISSISFLNVAVEKLQSGSQPFDISGAFSFGLHSREVEVGCLLKCDHQIPLSCFSPLNPSFLLMG
jgi:hypothetical protein